MTIINVIYTDNKHPYFEEKVQALAEAYHGKMTETFEYGAGAFSATIEMKSPEQEKAFKIEVEKLANFHQVPVEFGGVSNI